MRLILWKNITKCSSIAQDLKFGTNEFRYSDPIDGFDYRSMFFLISDRLFFGFGERHRAFDSNQMWSWYLVSSEVCFLSSFVSCVHGPLLLFRIVTLTFILLWRSWNEFNIHKKKLSTVNIKCKRDVIFFIDKTKKKIRTHTHTHCVCCMCIVELMTWNMHIFDMHAIGGRRLKGVDYFMDFMRRTSNNNNRKSAAP